MSWIRNTADNRISKEFKKKYRERNYSYVCHYDKTKAFKFINSNHNHRIYEIPYNSCFGSRLDLDSIWNREDPEWESRSGYRQPKKRKKEEISCMKSQRTVLSTAVEV